MAFEQGNMIGSYRILRRIGRGGMGTVYEVEHVGLGVHYALKTFTFNKEEDTGGVLKTKFLEEGKLLARLKHPNLTHVFDLAVEESSGTPYFVMDLVLCADGRPHTADDVDLSDLDEDTVFHWFKALASALDYIHAEGIVHRDIKPCNLLIDKDMNPVLTDFGISHIFGSRIKEELDATDTMVEKDGGKIVLGTKNYMAPEVAAGEDATPAADAYALGVMTLRWLTGFYYGDNPGAISLLSKCKYRWRKILPALLSSAPEKRPKTYSGLVEMLNPTGTGAGSGVSSARPAAGKAEQIRQFAIAGTVIGAVLLVAGIAVRAWRGDGGARVQNVPLVVTDTIVKTVEKPVERVVVKEPERRDETRPAPVANAGNAKTVAEKPEKELDLGQEPDLGQKADGTYAWVDGASGDPLPVKFRMDSGAVIDLIPRKPGVFYAKNDWSHDKDRHKVTLTYPYWIGKYYIAADALREFKEEDVRNCLPIEKVVGPGNPVYKKRDHGQYSSFCEYLTNKYRRQLPDGYVFRLATDAEIEYAYEWDATRLRYGLAVKGAGVLQFSAVVNQRWSKLRKEKNLDAVGKWNDFGILKSWMISVGGFSEPCASGLCEFGDHLVFDTMPAEARLEFSDEEVDPLRWVPGKGMRPSGKAKMIIKYGMDGRAYGFDRYRPESARIVLGPDLVGRRAWEKCRVEPKVDAVKVPQVRYEWKNPEQVPGKMSRPKELRFRMAGGEEMVFCTIPKGRYVAANPAGSKKPTRSVTISRPFWMTKYCVTMKQWREFAKYDGEDLVCKTLERHFPDNPVCVAFPRNKWVAYCRFLNGRYGSLLPDGYEFRLPTEAEYEWALVAEKDGDVRSANLDAMKPTAKSYCDAFDALWKKNNAPSDWKYDPSGIAGGFFVGGRTSPSPFGVCDLLTSGKLDNMVFDTYDMGDRAGKGSGEPQCANRFFGELSADVESETDPVRYAGRLALRVVRRWGAGKQMSMPKDRSFAHVVVAPKLPLVDAVDKAEGEPYPDKAFGGTLLSDKIRLGGVSSKLNDSSNTPERFRQMLSPSPAIVQSVDEGKDCRGFHTQKEKAPWILLELESKMLVTGIHLEVVAEPEKAFPLVIWASEDGSNFREIAREPYQRHRYLVDLQGKKVAAKSIKIGRAPNSREDWFFLDKILVYGRDR